MVSTLILTGVVCLSAGKWRDQIHEKIQEQSIGIVKHVVENYSFYDERFDPINTFKQELFEKETMFDIVNKEETEYFRKALDYDKSFKYVEGLEYYFVKDKGALEKTYEQSKDFICSLKTFNEAYGDKSETAFFEGEEEEPKPAEDVYDLGDGILLPKYDFDNTMMAVEINGKTKSGPLIGIQANRDACVAVYDTVNTAKGFFATGNPGLYGTLFKAIGGFAAGLGLSSLIADVVAKIGSAAGAIIKVLLSSTIGIILGIIVLIAVIAVISVLIGMYICGSKGMGFVIGFIANGWPWEWQPICDPICF